MLLLVLSLLYNVVILHLMQCNVIRTPANSGELSPVRKIGRPIPCHPCARFDLQNLGHCIGYIDCVAAVSPIINEWLSHLIDWLIDWLIGKWTNIRTGGQTIRKHNASTTSAGRRHLNEQLVLYYFSGGSINNLALFAEWHCYSFSIHQVAALGVTNATAC